MEKVFVIGAGTGVDAIEKAKKILALKEDIEIICVESMEDIPFNERIKSDPSLIQQIHQFSASQIIPVMPYFDDFKDKKRKGHERPYKYHR
jgi:hypothetical protein